MIDSSLFRLGRWTAALLLTTALAVSACNDSDDTDPGTGGNTASSSGTGPDCPDMSGTWQYTDHCQSALIGTTVEITQDGCDITNESNGFTGTLSSDGTFTTSGDVDDAGTSMTCVGAVTGTTFENDCTPGDCHVEGEKQ